MTVGTRVARLLANERLNFLLTNRVPRRTLTRLIGRLGRIEQPLVARASIALWRLFGGIDLSDAETQRFPSVHACFTRRLRPGARPIDPDRDVLASPCDAIIGANGVIADDMLLQVKGSPYRLTELLRDAHAASALEGWRYVTLRLTAGMYHHFHAPHDLRVERVRYIAGDCWNVNPPALKRIERLYCRNERAVIHTSLQGDGAPMVLIAVAAILVAGIRLCAVDRGLRSLAGDLHEPGIDAAKGEELGWFEHGSTIIMLVPPAYMPHPGHMEGATIRLGTPLFKKARHPDRR